VGRSDDRHVDDAAVDPATVPNRRLRTGDLVPAIGLGTFGSDHVDHDTVARAVSDAIRLGYRHLDCAAVYGNEATIGRHLANVFAAGLVTRDELWVTSKLWNDMHGPGDVLRSCRRTLDDLRVDHLDLYLVHWPFPNHHEPGVDVTARHADAQPYVHERFMATWMQMEELVTAGLVRNIGTSNMTIRKLRPLLADATIPPVANEMELHPHFQQPELFDFVVAHDIIPIGYSPIGSPARPERDRTPDDSIDIEDPVIVEIAAHHGTHPATLCVQWAQQRGQVPIPFSTNARNLLANLRSVVGEPLSDEEMTAIAGIDRGCRLIKGQVFCWKPDQSWHDLWDETGVNTTP